MMGGTYGRHVVVVAGPGNNGADGRVAGERLVARGARVTTVDARTAPDRLPPADLVVDAAFGTGLRRPYDAPDPGGAPVLAVDIPSGVDGLTGVVLGRAMRAARTVTFAALKPGLLLAGGRDLAGEVEVADIGLDTSGATIRHLGDDDLAAWPRRLPDAHKYHAAVWVVAGSPEMTGAPRLAAAAALRAGSGYVRLSVPGAEHHLDEPWEAVGAAVPVDGWAAEVAAGRGRIGALVVGPGLGRSDAVRREVGRLLGSAHGPMVLDGDGLWALAHGDESIAEPQQVVLTPHEGEFRALTGHGVGDDRIADVRSLAARLGAVVLLKGRTTVVADAAGSVRLVTSGDARLATAGTGDVLAGMIGAVLAAGVPPLDAAALAAHAHGRAASLGRRIGLVAGDLPDLLAGVL
jgi:NAD(P)H-hydrate epimerase